MIRRDLVSILDTAQSLAPAARTASANGSTVDLHGYGSAMFVVEKGTITDGTHTISAEESDDDSTWTAVAAADLKGTFTALTSSVTAKTNRVGYKGNKRYVRVITTVAGTTTGGVYGATVVRGHAEQTPLAA